MESAVKFLGHPVHQMLVVFPAGLLLTVPVFDGLHHLRDSTAMALVAFYLIAAGAIGALLAAPFGTLDWLKIPKGTRARRVGALHGLGNVGVLALYGLSLALRWDAPDAPGLLAQGLAAAGAGLAIATGWLGGELVDRLGIGVCDENGVNASSTLPRAGLRTEGPRRP